MNQYLKTAYDHGVQQAISDAGLSKTALSESLSLKPTTTDRLVRAGGAGIGTGAGFLLADDALKSVKNPRLRLLGLLGGSALGGVMGNYAGKGMTLTLPEVLGLE
mgnify:CR=1 FL=1|jgi:hypothetical protein